MWFYVDKNREQRGPVSVDDLKALLSAGDITKRSYLWQEGRADWTRLEDLANELGIKLAAPPPTPAATMVMQRAPVQPMPASPVQPMVPQPPPAAQPPRPAAAPPPSAPPAYQAPPPSAPPAYQAPPPSAPAYQAAQPPYPQAAPPQAAYPQQAPYAAGPVKSGGSKAWPVVLGGLIGIGFVVLKYAGHMIPGVSDMQAKAALRNVVSDMQPARAEVEEVFKAKQQCPGEALPLEVEITSNVVEDYTYGTMEDSPECAIQIDLPKDYKLKAIAGTRVLFVLQDGKWLCGMSAAAKYRPENCDEI
jgi:hypothetical protein